MQSLEMVADNVEKNSNVKIKIYFTCRNFTKYVNRAKNIRKNFLFFIFPILNVFSFNKIIFLYFLY